MNFLADESVEQQIVQVLRRDGHSVVYVAELKPGVSDVVVLTMANRLSALLVTADKDFGELVFRQGRISSGIILIRLAGLSQKAKAEAVSRAISEHSEELPNSFTVLSPGHARIRRRFP